MTNDQITQKLVWRDSNEARLLCFSPLFATDIKIEILTNHEGAVSDRTLRVIHDFLALSSNELEKIKQFLWEDCKLNCDLSSYGFDVPEGKTETQANHDEFGVHNGDDALRKSVPPSLSIYESDQETYKGNFGHLHFDNEWNSHLTTVVMRDGEIVGFGDSGLSLKAFESAG